MAVQYNTNELTFDDTLYTVWPATAFLGSETLKIRIHLSSSNWQSAMTPLRVPVRIIFSFTKIAGHFELFKKKLGTSLSIKQNRRLQIKFLVPGELDRNNFSF